MEDVCGVEVRRPGPRAAAAALLRRVDREPRAARVHAPRARLPRVRERVRDGARPPRDRRAARCALKKAGNTLMRVVGGREIHPINVRVGGFYRAPTRAELAPVVERARARARVRAARRSRFTAVAAVPGLRGGLRLRRAARARRATRSRAAAWSRAAASTSRPTSTRSTSSRSTSQHSTALHSRLRDGDALPRRAAGPLRAQPRPALAGGARGGRRGGPRAGVPQPVPQHRRARGGDPLRARRGAAADRRLRAAGPAGRRGAAARRRRATAGPRRRAACSGTATRSTTTGTILDARIVPPTSQNQGAHRAEPARLRRAARRRCDDDELQPALRAGGPQLRPVHLLRDALPATGDRPRVMRHRRRQRAGAATTAPASRSRGACASWRRRRRGPRARGRRDARSWTPGSGAEHVVVVDAAASGAPPGTRAPLRRRAPRPCRRAACAPRRTPSASPTPSSWRARSGRLPGRLDVYAIEGASFAAGGSLSPAVERAVDDLATALTHP